MNEVLQQILKKYKYVQKANDNLYLFENKKTHIKECFDLYDLGGIPEERFCKRYVYILYDNLTQKEFECETIKEVSSICGKNRDVIRQAIYLKRWLDKRWFCEKEERIEKIFMQHD